MIETIGDGRIRLLSGRTGSDAQLLTDRDELLHLHREPRMGPADAEEPTADPLPPYRPFGSPLAGHEECPAESGPRFVRPALSVRMPERAAPSGASSRHTRPTAGRDCGSTSRRVHGLALGLHHGLRDDADVIEHWVTPTHAGDGPALEPLRAGAAVWTLPPRDRRRLSQVHGTGADESRLVRSELTHGEKLIGSRRGRTGHQHVPWGAAATARPPRRRGRCGRPTDTDPLDLLAIRHGFGQLHPAVRYVRGDETARTSGSTGGSAPCASVSSARWPGRSASTAISPHEARRSRRRRAPRCGSTRRSGRSSSPASCTGCARRGTG